MIVAPKAAAMLCRASPPGVKRVRSERGECAAIGSLATVNGGRFSGCPVLKGDVPLRDSGLSSQTAERGPQRAPFLRLLGQSSGREGSAVFPSVGPRTNEKQIPRFARNDNSIEATIAR